MPLFTNIKFNRSCILAVLLIPLALYSLDTNFSPTPIFIQVAPLIWVPTGLVVSHTIIKDSIYFKKFATFPVWRKVLGYVVFGCFICWFARLFFVFGFGHLVTRMIGAPFQESSVIVKKASNRKLCFHRIDVDKFQPAIGGICLDGGLGNLPDVYRVFWDTSKKGDEVWVTGKRSGLGYSITDIRSQRQSSASQ